jgi:hypothetical protein
MSDRLKSGRSAVRPRPWPQVFDQGARFLIAPLLLGVIGWVFEEIVDVGGGLLDRVMGVPILAVAL